MAFGHAARKLPAYTSGTAAYAFESLSLFRRPAIPLRDRTRAPAIHAISSVSSLLFLMGFGYTPLHSTPIHLQYIEMVKLLFIEYTDTKNMARAHITPPSLDEVPPLPVDK